MKIAIPKEQRRSRPEAALLMWLLTRQSFGAGLATVPSHFRYTLGFSGRYPILFSSV